MPLTPPEDGKWSVARRGLRWSTPGREGPATGGGPGSTHKPRRAPGGGERPGTGPDRARERHARRRPGVARSEAAACPGALAQGAVSLPWAGDAQPTGINSAAVRERGRDGGGHDQLLSSTGTKARAASAGNARHFARHWKPIQNAGELMTTQRRFTHAGRARSPSRKVTWQYGGPRCHPSQRLSEACPGERLLARGGSSTVRPPRRARCTSPSRMVSRRGAAPWWRMTDRPSSRRAPRSLLRAEIELSVRRPPPCIAVFHASSMSKSVQPVFHARWLHAASYQYRRLQPRSAAR